MNNKSILLLFFDFISKFGSEVFSFAAAFFILKETGSSTLFALVITIISVIKGFSAPFLGVISDKFNNNILIIFSQVVSILSLLTFYLVTTHDIVFNLIVTIAFLSLTDTITRLVINSNIQVIAEENLEKVVSLRQSIQQLSSITAPALGGIIVSYITLKETAFLNLLTESISLILILFVPLTRTFIEESNFIDSFKSGVSYLLKNKILFNFMLNGMLTNCLTSSIIVGVPLLAINVFHFSSSQFGIIQSVFPISMLVSSIIFSVYILKKNIFRTLSISMFLIFIVLLNFSLIILLNTSSELIYILILLNYILFGFSLVYSNIPYSIYLQKNIDEEYKGRVLSLNQSIVSFLTPLFVMIYGYTFKYSFFLTYFITAILMFGVFLHVLIIKNMGNETERIKD